MADFHTLPRLRRLLLVLTAGLAPFFGPALIAAEVPLILGNRTIHTFREPLSDIAPEERAAAARVHINQALQGSGEGWTSIAPTPQGILVALDGEAMFTVSPGDARKELGETVDSLANQASRELQKVWSESRERRQPGLNGPALIRIAKAFALLAVILVILIALGRWLRLFLVARLASWLKARASIGLGAGLTGVILRLFATLSAVLLWLFGLLVIFVFISFTLGQFAVTRPFSENLLHSLRESAFTLLGSAAAALPGVFVAVVIFALARIITQVSRALFDQIISGRWHWGALDAHTAPAAGYLVNAAIWLFAVAMAYPYLPGSDTEAFKGLSVLLGLMVSIGAAGPVGQIASGLILAFTRALRVGEYVRILDSEGTVTHLGLCVTRLRTGTDEEIALPNSVVMGNITRNFSRHVLGQGYVIEAGVTIGYDTPWRQVHALLLEAAGKVSAVRAEPAPFVVQTDLSDFYVGYRLVVHAGTTTATRLQVASDLNAAIQDEFARQGVQIMSPHYEADPAKAKIPPAS